MRAILLIDHGSVRDEANNMLACMAMLLQHMVGDAVHVEHAHMELARPDVGQGFDACVRAGATEVIAFPYMLSPGKHSTRDIPRLVAEAAESHPQVRFAVTPAFGVHEKLAEIIAQRAGVEIERGAADCRCWSPTGEERWCGAACTMSAERGTEPPGSGVREPAFSDGASSGRAVPTTPDPRTPAVPLSLDPRPSSACPPPTP